MGERLTALVKRPLPEGAVLGSTITIVQFSSAFCQPCRATRRIIRRVVDDLVSSVDGIEVVDIDADDHLELTRMWEIESTPTVVFLNPRGVEVLRATGQPRTVDVVAAVAQVVDGDP